MHQSATNNISIPVLPEVAGRSSMPPVELQVVGFILRHQPYVAAPNNLGGPISSFLGPASNLSLSHACTFGSLSLLNWIWDCSCTLGSESPSGWTLTNFLRSDTNYYRWQFSKALEVVAETGDLKIVKWLFEHFSGCVVPVKAVEAAAANGHLLVLKFLHDQDAEQHICAQMVPTDCNGPGNIVSWGGKSLLEAIKNGHRDVAQWLHQSVPHELNQFDSERVICAALEVGEMEFAELFLPPNRTIFEYAINCSHPDIIEMMFNAGHLQQNPNDPVVAIRNLAGRGQLSLMQRVAQIHNPPPTNDDVWLAFWCLTMHEAIKRGDLPMFKWLMKHPTGRDLIGKKKKDDERPGFLTEAASRGHVGTMQYLYDEDMADDYESALVSAVRNGHLDVVRWLMIHITEYDHNFMDEAAMHGHLSILKFFHGTEEALVPAKCQNSRQTELPNLVSFITSDSTGHHVDYDELAAMKTIRSMGCSQRAMNYAAAHGFLEVLQWLHANRAEGCTTFAMDNAAANGNLDVVKWLHHNRWDGCTTQAMDGAAEAGHMKIIEWLDDNRHEGCTFKAIEESIANGHLQVADWLRKHYPEHFPALVGKSICTDKIFDVLLFLHVHYPHVFTIWFCSRIQRPLLSENGLESDALVVAWLEKHYPDHETSDESP